MLDSFVLFVVTTVVLAFVMDRIKRKKKGGKWIESFPGPRCVLPIVGNAWEFAGPGTKTYDKLKEYAKKFGKIYRFWMFSQPYIFIADSASLKKILSSSVHVEKGSMYKGLASLVGKHTLAQSPGHQWRIDRKTFIPAFQKETQDIILINSNIEAKSVTDHLTREVISGSRLEAVMNKCFLKIIMRTMVLGDGLMESDIFEKSLHLLEVGKNLARIKLMQPWMTNPVLWRIFGYETKEKRLHEQFADIYKKGEIMFKGRETEATQENSGEGNTKKSLARIIFDERKPHDWRLHQMVGTILAAMDTTAASVKSTLFFLALHEECLSRAQAEVDSVLDTDEDINYEHISQLKYVEMCWKEAMRLHPPGPLIGRSISEDVYLDDGRVLPSQTDVIINIAHVHMDPENFPNPEKYDPERFESEIKPYSYMPFSAGPRNCLGMKLAYVEAKVVIAHILRKFSLSTTQREEDIKMVYAGLCDPHPPLEVRFLPRR